MKNTKYDYDQDLDMLHIYTSDIDRGIKGGLTYGNFTIDIGEDDKVVGIELEGASSLLKMSPDILSHLDNVQLSVQKTGNVLFMGFSVAKGNQQSTIQINVPTQRKPVLSH